MLLLNSQVSFHDLKITILDKEVQLRFRIRDNKPGLLKANMWDMAGGGKERDEMSLACILRVT